MSHANSKFFSREAVIHQLIADMMGAHVRIPFPAVIGDVGGRNGI
jgi:hypothetical protein